MEGKSMPELAVTEDTPFVEADDTYHAASDDPLWFETNWWSLNVPERRLGLWMHAGYHTNRNEVTWRVFAWDDTGADPARLAYYQARPNVPMPPDPDLRDITFPGGGYSVKMVRPLMDYDVMYADPDANFSIEFEHRSVHPPHRFTPGQPPAMHNPHLDQLGHVTGELVLRGERIPVDCYSIRDRTWGRAVGTTPSPHRRQPPRLCTALPSRAARGGARSSGSGGAGGSSTSSVTPTPPPASSVSSAPRTATPGAGH